MRCSKLREITSSLVEVADRYRPIRHRAGHGRRDGISLLEVLISIFVLAIGLLGVAAVIPLGRLQAQRAIQSHRIAGMGQSKLREMQLGHVLDPRYWVYLSVDTGKWEPVVIDDGNGVAGFPLKGAWFFDPLFVAKNIKDLDSSNIPFDPGSTALCPLRISMVAPHLAGNNNPPGPIRYPLAERMFTGTDDQLVSLPEDVNERPRQMVLSMDASNQLISAAWPAREADNLMSEGESVDIDEVNDGPLVRESQGGYTYLITIVPEAATPDFYDDDDHPRVYLDKLRLVVSVVVFHQRDLSLPDQSEQLDPNIPSERNVTVAFKGGGWGGGDVVLVADAAGDLDIEEGEWLMIHSEEASDYTLPAKWYQMVASGEVESGPKSGEYQRRVTLSGPDWRLGATDMSETPQGAVAILMTNVVGVYTTTIQPDFHSSAWGLAN